MKLADRMSRLGVESAFDVLVRAKALEAKGKNVIHLEIGEPDFPTPPHIVEAGKRANLLLTRQDPMANDRDDFSSLQRNLLVQQYTHHSWKIHDLIALICRGEIDPATQVLLALARQFAQKPALH